VTSDPLGPLLPRDFAERDALEVAIDLVGALLMRDEVVLRITEVEAYRWPGDTANHCRMGRTPRNAPMWGPAGHAYVYLCYGQHVMLNVVTGREGEGAAVLVRACEPLAGLDVVRARRRGRDGRPAPEGPALLTGPGRVGAALGLDTSWSGHPLYEAGGLELRAGRRPEQLLTGPRVGIGYASARDRRARWRIAEAGTPWVSHRRTLRPLPRRPAPLDRQPLEFTFPRR
jgi:DNA-3-methyladenine glycosylase